MNKLGKVAVALAMVFSIGAAGAETPAKFVDYIESDGGGGQYVTLGDYRPKGDSILVATFSTANRKISHSVFCSRGADSKTDSISLFHVTTSGLRFDYGITDAVGQYKNVKPGEDVKCTVGINNANFYLDGANKKDLNRTKADFTAGGPVMLFASYTTTEGGEIDLSTLDNYAKMRLYRFQAYDRTADGEIVPMVNLWPCVDANGVAGLYDSLSGTIYRSAGENAFAASETETEGPNATVDKLVSTCGGTDWFNGANWSLGVPPTAAQDVVIDGLTANAAGSIDVKSLTVRGAKGVLNLGSSADRPNITATIAEDLFVTNGATVNVYAGRLPDYVAKFEEGKAAFHAALYTNANVVTIGGDLTVGASSFLKPNNDPLTGTPVFFKVGGDFNLEAGGTVSADDGGWDWLDSAGATIPKGAKTGTHKVGSTSGIACYCLATSAGSSYSTAGSYGGPGYNAAATAVYGFQYAPYLPGSPGGAYKGTPESCGGGSIVLFVSGAATLDGTLTAQAGSTGYGRGSGGSIWVAAQSIGIGDRLVANASGRNSSNGNYAVGGGGRIAFEAGVTEEDLDAFLDGQTPDRLVYEELTFAGLTVAGGVNSQAPTKPGKAGTAVNVYDPESTATLEIVGFPQDEVSSGVAYGSHVISFGKARYEVVDYGYDVNDKANVRYTCGGFVVSNATSEVASGAGTSVEFEVKRGEGPYTLVWKWGARETKQTVTVPTTGLGSVTVDGAPVTETTSFWYPETAMVAVTAVPADGATFACWQGDVDWPGSCTAAITLTAADVHSISPRFYTTREGAVRTWKGNDGDYYTAANWTDGVVPGPLDSIVITKGTCTARKYLEVAALTLSGSGKLTVSGAYDIKVAGDLTLTNGVTLTVNGTPRTDDRTFETGTTHVQVGGDFVIATNATLKVDSDDWTGGSPVFKVAGGFELAAGATINADKSGWSWTEYTGTKSPLALATATANTKKWQTMALGHGSSYGTAGTYGGRGGATNGNMPGVPYGFANAPIYPGSPNGVYNETLFTAGGGLVRIHVDGFATVAGAITANGGTQGSDFGGSSGGGIWLTAAKFAFAPTAKLSVKGGPSGYSSLGGGGRIAIGTGLTAAQMASLIATGTCGRRAKDDAFFKAEFPGVAVDVSRGNPTGSWAPYGEAGSFSYYPMPQGLMLLVK